MKEEFMYEDIINLPHHKSKTRKHMPLADRAAQFAPFAALTGHGDAIDETARTTLDRIELDEYSKEEINYKLICIRDEEVKGDVCITYFVADSKKSGGDYQVANGKVIKIKEFERIVVMEDNTEIPIDDIISIEGENI